MTFLNLRVDPVRHDLDPFCERTGIMVRARGDDGQWYSVDIAELDEPSLTKWLQRDGGYNLLAENVVRIMLQWPIRAKDHIERTMPMRDDDPVEGE